ncbi:hypothetical protein PoB_002194200 [Plakobranchus ocellatus]|uniref:Uncharacterized protein n=1 Tax=Plakobranchus ocellatus TaxID=259542 RepID=A0AAV3ZLQ3_9GAST|nr:hypothetical protein PoB_002194200 [Plakobranchus ocellatus]
MRGPQQAETELSMCLEEKSESSPLRVDLPPPKLETGTSKVLRLDHIGIRQTRRHNGRDKNKLDIEVNSNRSACLLDSSKAWTRVPMKKEQISTRGEEISERLRTVFFYSTSVLKAVPRIEHCGTVTKMMGK